MVKSNITQIKKENERLNRLAELDWLTGLYNRGAVEEKVNELLRKRKAGVLLVMDVDHFKDINDRYGHIAGDQALKKIADILGGLTFRNDILGRVGGDEFVVFMPVLQSQEFVESRCRQIRQYFQDFEGMDAAVSRLSITVCGSIYHEGDDYRSLFDRADQLLLVEKRKRRRRLTGQGGEGSSSLEMDLGLISCELSEPGVQGGAYCQDYDTFVSIYRFVERRLSRSEASVYSLLFTLSDKAGDFPALQDRENLLGGLKDVIQNSLRLGDVFAQYSSCQFVVMVSDVVAEDADRIGARILNRFRQRCSIPDYLQISCQRHPLKPVTLTGQEDDTPPDQET